MKPEDLYLYYSSIEGEEFVHTYWNGVKVSVRKENKTEQFCKLNNKKHSEPKN